MKDLKVLDPAFMGASVAAAGPLGDVLEGDGLDLAFLPEWRIL